MEGGMPEALQKAVLATTLDQLRDRLGEFQAVAGRLAASRETGAEERAREIEELEKQLKESNDLALAHEQELEAAQRRAVTMGHGLRVQLQAQQELSQRREQQLAQVRASWAQESQPLLQMTQFKPDEANVEIDRLRRALARRQEQAAKANELFPVIWAHQPYRAAFDLSVPGRGGPPVGAFDEAAEVPSLAALLLELVYASQGEPHTLIELFTALEALIFSDHGCIDALVRDGGIELVFRAMRTHEDHITLQTCAVRLLWKTATNTPANARLILRGGGLAAIINALLRNTFEPEVQYGCSEALRALLPAAVLDHTATAIGAVPIGELLEASAQFQAELRAQRDQLDSPGAGDQARPVDAQALERARQLAEQAGRVANPYAVSVDGASKSRLSALNTNKEDSGSRLRMVKRTAMFNSLFGSFEAQLGNLDASRDVTQWGYSVRLLFAALIFCLPSGGPDGTGGAPELGRTQCEAATEAALHLLYKLLLSDPYYESVIANEKYASILVCTTLAFREAREVQIRAARLLTEIFDAKKFDISNLLALGLRKIVTDAFIEHAHSNQVVTEIAPLCVHLDIDMEEVRASI